MFVGIVRVVLRIPDARSLKDRRQVVRSFKGRLTAKLNVSVAEVGDVEHHQTATLGIVTVSRESDACRRVLHEIRQMASTLPEALLVDVKGEVQSMGSSGAQLRGGVESLLSDPEGWYFEDKEKP